MKASYSKETSFQAEIERIQLCSHLRVTRGHANYWDKDNLRKKIHDAFEKIQKLIEPGSVTKVMNYVFPVEAYSVTPEVKVPEIGIIEQIVNEIQSQNIEFVRSVLN